MSEQEISRAWRLHKEARELDSQGQQWYVRVGYLCVEVEDTGCWKELCTDDGEPFTSFSKWLEYTMPQSDNYARDAKTAIRQVKGHVMAADLCEMTRANVKTLSECSPAVMRDERVVHAAKHRTNKQFIDQVNEWYPMQRLEHRDPFHFAFSDEEKAHIRTALEDFRVLNETPVATLQEMFVALAVDFHSENWERAQAKKLQVESPTLELVQ